MNGFDEQESADAEAAGFDVSPRTGPDHEPTAGSGPRRLLAVSGVVVVLGALGLVLFNGLTDATLFYYDVDEAVDMRDELEDRRFRMQGNVLEDTTVATDAGIAFTIAYGDVELQVRHRGDPPELFNEEIPVIIEGSFVGDEFHSDEILIKHDSTYEEEHDARLRDAQDDVERRSGEAG